MTIDERARLRQLHGVVELAQGVAALDIRADGWSGPLADVAAKTADLLKAHRVYVVLRRPRERLNGYAAGGPGWSSGMEFTASERLIGRVLDERQGRVISDVEHDQDFADDPQLRRHNVVAVACAPLAASDTTVGVLYAEGGETAVWGESVLDIINPLAACIALRVWNVALQSSSEENRRLAMAGQAVLKLSHSVKNILQMIGGAAEVVDFGLQTKQLDRVRRSWDILRPNLDRMRKFMLDMLDYSKERRLEIERCDFNRLIEGAVEVVQAQLESALYRKKVKLTLRTDRNVPAIEMDPERVHEMALNFLLNAIDAVGDSGGAVHVQTQYLSDRKVIQLTVSDNGRGMSEEMLEKIFTPFESDKNKFGTGLGMAIAKQVADQHHGRIEIQTERGRGTTFTISLPVNAVQSQPV